MHKTCTKNVPSLGSQDGKGDEAIVHLKFFINGWTWFLTELDVETGRAFGKVFSPMQPEGELGYFDMNELAELKAGFGNAIERDRYWKPCKLSELKNPCA